MLRKNLVNTQSLNFAVVAAQATSFQAFAQLVEELPGKHQVESFLSTAYLYRAENKVDVLIIYEEEGLSSHLREQQLQDVKQFLPDVPVFIAGNFRFTLEPLDNLEVDDIPRLRGLIPTPISISYLCVIVNHVLTEQYTAQFRAVNNLSNEITRKPDKAVSLQTICHTIINRLKSYGLAICYVLKGKDLECHAFQYHRFAVAPQFASSLDEVDAQVERALRKGLLNVAYGEGLFGRVVKERQEIIQPEFLHQNNDKVPAILQELFLLGGVIAMPLRIREDVIGVIACFTRYPGEFSQRHVQQINTYANLAALEAYHEKKVKILERLDQLSQALLDASDSLSQSSEDTLIDDAFNRLIDNVTDIGDAQGAAVCAYDVDYLRFLSERYQYETDPSFDIIPWNSQDPDWYALFKTVIDTKQPYLEGDVAARAELGEIQQCFLEKGVQAFIVLPLVFRGFLRGVLFVFYEWSHPYAIDQLGDKAHYFPLETFVNGATQLIGRAFEQRRNDMQTMAIEQWALLTDSGLPLQGSNKEFYKRYLADPILKDTGGEFAGLCIKRKDKWEDHIVVISGDFPKRSEHYCAQRRLDVNSIEHLLLNGRWDKKQQFKVHRRSDDVYCILVEFPSARNVQGYIFLESRQPTLNHDDIAYLDALVRHIGISVQRDTAVQKLLEGIRRFSLMQPIRRMLEDDLRKLHDDTGCEIAILFTYSPYWERFNLPIVVGDLSFANIALHYDREKLIALMSFLQELSKKSYSEYHHQEAGKIASIFPSFIKREEIAFSRATRLQSEAGNDETIGLLITQCRHPRQPTPAEDLAFRQVVVQLQQRLSEAHFFPQVIHELQNVFKADIVRLHLFRSSEETWSSPFTVLRKGLSLNVQKEWRPKPLTTTGGPISHACRRYYHATYSPDNYYHFVDDVTQDHSGIFHGRFTIDEAVISAGYVLLRAHEEVVGILFVSWRDLHLWTESEKNVLLTFAQQAAQGIYNRRTLRNLDETSFQSNWVQGAVGSAVQAGWEQTKTLEVLLEQLVAITGASIGGVRLETADHERPGLEIRAVFGDAGFDIKAQEWESEHSHIYIDEEALVSKAYQSGEPIFIPNLQEWKGAYRDTSNGRTKSEIIVPIKEQYTGKPLGIVNLQSDKLAHKGGLDETHLIHTIAFANMLSMIIRNQENIDLMDFAALAGIFSADWHHKARHILYALKWDMRRFERALNPEAQEYFERIDRKIRELTSIPEKELIPRKLQEAPSLVDVTAVIHDVVQQLVATTSNQNIQVEQPQDVGPVLVRMHRSLLEKAVNKLIGNAIQHGASYSHQSEKWVRVTCEIEDEMVLIDVHDNGPGIARDVRGKLFRKRVRGKHSYGMGMGCILTAFILNRYGGQASVITTGNTGTHVRIELPHHGESI